MYKIIYTFGNTLIFYFLLQNIVFFFSSKDVKIQAWNFMIKDLVVSLQIVHENWKYSLII